jgi:hypothetical protein
MVQFGLQIGFLACAIVIIKVLKGLNGHTKPFYFNYQLISSDIWKSLMLEG